MKKTTKKRTLSVLLCMALVVSLYQAVIFADDADILGDGIGSDTGDTAELMGDGDGSDVNQENNEENKEINVVEYVDEINGIAYKIDANSGTAYASILYNNTSSEVEIGENIPLAALGIEQPVGRLGGVYPNEYTRSIKISNKISVIDSGVFYDAKWLTKVTLPNGLTAIHDGAFQGCSGLESIDIPASVEYIGENAFKYCTSLKTVTFSDGYAVNVSDCQLKEIGNGAFTGCSSLTNVQIPSSVKTIGDEAFYECSSLGSIELPDGLTTIGDSAFEYCSGLYSVNIPSSVTTIKDEAFSGCTSLANITIPNGVTEIGAEAFGDSGLVSIALPDSLTEISMALFNRCTRLASVTIPEGVTTIGKGAFSDCTSLTSLTIPSSVTTLDACEAGEAEGGEEELKNTFEGCTSLADVWIQKKENTISGSPWGAGAGTQIHWIGGIISPDYSTGVLSGFEEGYDYTVTCGNESKKVVPENGTIAIEENWYGKTITIEKKNGAESETQEVKIPARPAAPTTVKTVDASGSGASDGQITGVSSAMEYKSSDATEWIPCNGDTVTGLPAGTYMVRDKATATAFASEPVIVIIMTDEPFEPTELKIDYEAGVITGLEPGAEYIINGKSVTPGADGKVVIDKEWYGTNLTIEKRNADGSTSSVATIAIPKKPAAPTSVSFVNASSAGASDGQITGVSTEMEYRAMPVNDAAISWKSCEGDTVTGLTPGKYEVRIKAINGQAFASDIATVTIGTKAESNLHDNDRDDDDVFKIDPYAKPVVATSVAVTVDPNNNTTSGTGITQTENTGLENAVADIQAQNSSVQAGPYVTSDSSNIKVQIPSRLQKSGRHFYLVSADENGDAEVLEDENTDDEVFEAEGEADTDYQLLYDDEDTPLSGGVDDQAAEDNCINHFLGIFFTLLGLIAAALLAKKGSKYIWAPAIVAILLSETAAAKGSCSLDWVFFTVEVVVTVAAVAALMHVKKDEQTDATK